MFSPEEINEIYKQLIGRMESTCRNKNEQNGGEQDNCGNIVSFTPSQIVVIIGLLTGALEVNSVLIDRNQTVIVYLVGDFKTSMAKAMEQTKSISFEELLKSILAK